MEVSTEHFTPQKTSLYEIEVNVDRYMFALKYLEGKTVVDLGCGAGMGTYLYSLIAKKVIAVDYDAKALEEAKEWPYPAGKVEFLQLDLEDKLALEKLPEADVYVALEVLEHIEKPALVLRAMKTKQLVFSVPLHSMEVSSWHKFRIDDEDDVRTLIEKYFQIGDFEKQEHTKIGGAWMRGEAIKFTGN